jgi:OPA family sugar phosphate sensor protein UhpC-like MFS transporter
MDPLLSQWRSRIFAATWLSYAGYYFCRKPFYIAKSTLGKNFEWDAATLGLIGTGFLIAYSAGQFVSGAAGMRWGPRILVLSGMGVSIAVNFAMGFTNSIGSLATFMIVNGLAQSTGWPGNVATMGNWFHRRERGTVMGFWATNFQVGGVAANALAAWALGQWGFRYSFFAGSVVLLLVWAFFIFHQRNRPEDLSLPPVRDPMDEVIVENPPPPRQDEPARQSAWTSQMKTNVLIIGVFYFFVKFNRYAIWSWAPFILNRNLEMKADQAGYLATLFEVAGILGVIAAGWISDRFFRGRRVRISFVFILGLVLFSVLLYAVGTRSALWFGICIALVGFFLYGPDALMSAAGAIDAGTRETTARAVGIINGMGSVGPVLQELVLGRLLDWGGPSPVFATLMVSSILAAFCLGVLLWRNRMGLADL